MSKILFQQPISAPESGVLPVLPGSDVQFAAQNRTAAGAINATWPAWRTYFRAQGTDLALSEYLTIPDAADLRRLTGTGTVKSLDTAGKYPGDVLAFVVATPGVVWVNNFDKTTIPVIDRPANYATLAPVYTATGSAYTTSKSNEPIMLRLMLLGATLAWVEIGKAGGGGGTVDFSDIETDVKIINHGLYLSQNAGVDTVGDERYIAGAHQKYVTGAGWVDVSVAANGALTNYLGEWNAATNTPTITSGVGTEGDWYKVGTAGSTVIDGLGPWGTRDVIWFSGSAGKWQIIDNKAATVAAPQGPTGAVQIMGADGKFSWYPDVIFNFSTNALDLRRMHLYGGLLTTPVAGTLERDATELYYTANDAIRRALATQSWVNTQGFLNSNSICPVGAGATYTTIKAAFDAGYRRMVQVGNISEPTNFTVAETIEIFGDKRYTVTISAAITIPPGDTVELLFRNCNMMSSNSEYSAIDCTLNDTASVRRLVNCVAVVANKTITVRNYIDGFISSVAGTIAYLNFSQKYLNRINAPLFNVYKSSGSGNNLPKLLISNFVIGTFTNYSYNEVAAVNGVVVSPNMANIANSNFKDVVFLAALTLSTYGTNNAFEICNTNGLTLGGVDCKVQGGTHTTIAVNASGATVEDVKATSVTVANGVTKCIVERNRTTNAIVETDPVNNTYRANYLR